LAVSFSLVISYSVYFFLHDCLGGYKNTRPWLGNTLRKKYA